MLRVFIFFAFNLIVISQQQSNNFLIGLGDSFTSNGGSESYPLVAGNLLNWRARNFAAGETTMSGIAAQLNEVGSLLSNVTHIVLTISAYDFDVSLTIQDVIFNGNLASAENKIWNLKPQLVSTYKMIRAAVRPGTKIYAIPYVDVISVNNITPHEDMVHQVMETHARMTTEAAQEANIGYIKAVQSAFRGHEMFSADPYCNGIFELDGAHPNLKGHFKIGEIVADYLKSH